MPSPSTPGHDENSPQAPGRVDGTTRRRRYRPPAIVLRERIETMAADCTIPGGKNDASCILGFS